MIKLKRTPTQLKSRMMMSSCIASRATAAAAIENNNNNMKAQWQNVGMFVKKKLCDLCLCALTNSKKRKNEGSREANYRKERERDKNISLYYCFIHWQMACVSSINLQNFIASIDCTIARWYTINSNQLSWLDDIDAWFML